jgi:hypothetical protein
MTVLETTQDARIRVQAAESLVEIDPSNPKVIEAHISLLEITQNDDTLMLATEYLVDLLRESIFDTTF